MIKGDIYLVFGFEFYGIDRVLLSKNIENIFRIFINDKIRSFNLLNVVVIIVYEVLR